MTFVNITALSFPEGAGAEIERRFAARQKGVDAAAGFEGFELLRRTSRHERRGPRLRDRTPQPLIAECRASKEGTGSRR